MIVEAEVVIAQDLHHSAFADRPPAALIDHTLELRLQSLQAPYPIAYRAELTGCDLVGLIAWPLRLRGQREQLAHRLERKTQPSCVANEREPLDVPSVEDALVA